MIVALLLRRELKLGLVVEHRQQGRRVHPRLGLEHLRHPRAAPSISSKERVQYMLRCDTGVSAPRRLGAGPADEASAVVCERGWQALEALSRLRERAQGRVGMKLFRLELCRVDTTPFVQQERGSGSPLLGALLEDVPRDALFVLEKAGHEVPV